MAEAALRREVAGSAGTGRQSAVRQVLDKVKAEGRTGADGAGGQARLRRLRHSGAEGRRRELGRRTAAKLAAGMGFPVVLKIVSPDILHKTEAGGVLVGVKSAEEVAKAYDTILANAKKYKADAKIDGVQVQQMLKGGTGSHRRRGHRRLVRQARRVRPRRRARRGAEGHHLPPRAGDHATTRCRCSTASRRPRCCSGVRGGEPVEPRGARRHDRRASRSSSATSPRSPSSTSTRSSRPRRARSPPTCASSSISTPQPARYRPPHDDIVRGDEPHHEAEGGRRDRRLRRGRQDRQLGDEEPHQRRLQGPDLPDPPEGRRDHGLQGLQERQGRARRDRRRGLRDSGEVRRRRR